MDRTDSVDIYCLFKFSALNGKAFLQHSVPFYSNIVDD